MKASRKFRAVIGLIFCIALSSAILVGCATKNPDAVQNPTTGTWSAAPYVPNQTVGTVSNTLSAVSAATAPFNPYAAITTPALSLGLAAASLIAGWVAAAKNKGAVIDTMAAGIIKAGAAPTVLNHASNTPQFVAVADAINANTGANQGPSGGTS